mmetsp:Transcript_12495/g.18873  ORF Transcript_12495/g.18873 Transcript_12495/m.18873 type:complete len:478 (-) Transcript_12495:73-1506(-)
MRSFLYVLALVSAQFGSSSVLNTSFLEFDSNGHLSKSYLLYSANTDCEKLIKAAWNRGNDYSYVRDLLPMDDNFAQQYGTGSCVAVCLNKGMEEGLLSYPLPQNIYTDNSDIGAFNNECRGAEVGFISYMTHPVSLYWLNKKTGESVLLDTIQKGEMQMKWHTSFLGHVFEVRDSVTDEKLKTHVVEFSGVVVVGDAGPGTISNPIPENRIQNAMKNEWTRCNRVKRTFTELGFAKGKLPQDIWASISTYNYNNKHNAAREEWDRKGYFVNWWEVTPYLLGMPWGLKRYWQGRLKDLVEKWIGGIPLETTDIYGIRRYEDGARLLTHVDREATHAASLIINVDQVGMREPWVVEIYDFAGRLHEIPMEPGEVVYYESARCLHGRMKPLNGVSYSNLFAHYRPVGDPDWFTKENPPGTPEQLINIGECVPHSSGSGMECDGKHLPYLSSSREVVQGPNDLFEYWKKVSPIPQTQHTEL